MILCSIFTIVIYKSIDMLQKKQNPCLSRYFHGAKINVILQFEKVVIVMSATCISQENLGLILCLRKKAQVATKLKPNLNSKYESLFYFKLAFNQLLKNSSSNYFSTNKITGEFTNSTKVNSNRSSRSLASVKNNFLIGEWR